jgi:membrane-bound lytic murein transglycosylase D
MSENDLRSVNNIPPRMLIKAGSTLLVSRSAKTQSDVAESVVDNAQLSLAPEVRTQRTLVKARKGDSLASLAKRYNLAASSVAEWNSLKGIAALKAGQSVVVFLPVKNRARSQSSARAGATKSGVKTASRQPAPRAKKR